MLRIVAAIVAALPGLFLAWRAWQGHLGPDPLGELTRVSGRWALTFLVLSLVPTALRILTGVRAVMPLRRVWGLAAFAYATAHMLIYVGLGFQFRWRLLFETISQSPFILVGMAALALLIPLALTSTNAWVRRLGRVWRRIHRLAYVAALLAAWHYLWAYKELRLLPIAVAVLVMCLLAIRLRGVSRRFDRRHRPREVEETDRRA